MKRSILLLSLVLVMSNLTMAKGANPTHMKTKTIVLIHGLFMNSLSWEPWKIHLEKAGYNVIVPNYPYHQGNPAQLKQVTNSPLGKLTLTEVLDHYIKIIEQLDEKPILIGHSIGGLLVQLLVNRDLAEKGISIDPAPPKGLTTFKWSFLKANISTINPFKGNKVCLPSVKWYRYAFCNTMTLEETQKIYDQYVVPESRNIPRQSTKKAGKVDFKKKHVPLLIIGGEKDHIIPASLNRKNARKYDPAAGKVDFKEFPGRTHILCNQEGWEEIADYILDWIGEN